MMTLDKAMKSMKFDKRLTEWQLAQGHLTKEELKKHLDALPDLAKQVEILSLGDDRNRQDAH